MLYIYIILVTIDVNYTFLLFILFLLLLGPIPEEEVYATEGVDDEEPVDHLDLLLCFGFLDLGYY